MKIRLLKEWRGNRPGAIVEAEQDEAKKMIGSGAAQAIAGVKAEEPQKKTIKKKRNF